MFQCHFRSHLTWDLQLTVVNAGEAVCDACSKIRRKQGTSTRFWLHIEDMALTWCLFVVDTSKRIKSAQSQLVLMWQLHLVSYESHDSNGLMSYNGFTSSWANFWVIIITH